MKTLPSSVMSFTETEMEAAIACAKHRLVIGGSGYEHQNSQSACDQVA